MSIRFSIKHATSKAEKEGDAIVNFSGHGSQFFKVDERDSKEIGADASGKAKIVFNTGLDDKQVDFYKWYSPVEKKELKKHITDLKPVITSYFGGEDVIDPMNKFFWGQNRDVNRISLTNDDLNVFYDTKNPVHALLYLSIASGAFKDMIAPTKDWAERYQIPFYMALDTEDLVDEDDDITRSDAHGALADLRRDSSPEALFILAWCIQYDTNGYGAYLKSTSQRDLINYHIKYIDGKIVTKKKRNTPAVFMEYVEKWKGQTTRPSLYVEAYVKAGEYYSFINQREKKFVTIDGTVLGNTIEDAVKELQKPKNQADLEKLRDLVEAKWKE